MAGAHRSDRRPRSVGPHRDVIRFYVWSGVPLHRALPRLAADRIRLRALPFARLLGTARGFDIASTDLHRGLLMVRADESFEASPVVRGWDALASERASLTLRPLASRGSWRGSDPFGSGTRWDGPVLSLTHARLSPMRIAGFNRALPAVAEAALAADGLRWWTGFGEAPVGFKGNLTAWSSSAAASDFAFRSPVHVHIIRRTPIERWYTEELFTRFALLDADGTLDGVPAAHLAAAESPWSRDAGRQPATGVPSGQPSRRTHAVLLVDRARGATAPALVPRPPKRRSIGCDPGEGRHRGHRAGRPRCCPRTELCPSRRLAPGHSGVRRERLAQESLMIGPYNRTVQTADGVGTAGRRQPASAAERALVDYVDVAVGRRERPDPTSGTSGGPAGNARLTAWIGLILLLGSFVEGLTLISIGGFLSWHIIVGTLLVPPALVKTATTSWRFGRYYTGHGPYRSAGPPILVLRVAGPIVVLSTLGLLGSGLALIAVGPDSSRTSLFALPGVDVNAITVHQILFFIWVAAMTVHVIGRLVPALATLAGRHRATSVPGRTARGGIVLATLAAAALAAVLVGAGSHGWTNGFHHRSPREHSPAQVGSEHP